MSHKTMLQTRQ